jgi:demethylmenaquinone methyltransferase / 2-methoxy-6-polyprenyl-1,4-benzoquinol methylase
MAAPMPAGRRASDGSPYPERGVPTFERDVRRMFAHLARRYEWFNHVAALGNDLLWRQCALWELDRFRRGPVRRAIDLGCGTGEFARALAVHYPSAQVLGFDFTRAMVVEARDREGRRGPNGPPQFGTGNILRLPVADACADLVTNAFVARNLRDLLGAFAEMRRVLRPGGVAVTLEISEPPSPAFRALFHAHFDKVVPMIGRAVHSEGPSRYLPESLRGFPPRHEVRRMMEAAGFTRTEARTYSLGIVTVYLAEAGPPPATQSR